MRLSMPAPAPAQTRAAGRVQCLNVEEAICIQTTQCRMRRSCATASPCDSCRARRRRVRHGCRRPSARQSPKARMPRTQSGSLTGQTRRPLNSEMFEIPREAACHTAGTKTLQQLHVTLQTLYDRKSLTMVPSSQRLRSGRAKRANAGLSWDRHTGETSESKTYGKKSAHPG